MRQYGTASSAMLMSPKTRTRTDTARPYSSRNTRSMSCAAKAGASGANLLDLVVEGTHLDRKRCGARELTAPLERGVEVGRTDDCEPTDMLLTLGERSVGREHLAV